MASALAALSILMAVAGFLMVAVPVLWIRHDKTQRASLIKMLEDLQNIAPTVTQADISSLVAQQPGRASSKLRDLSKFDRLVDTLTRSADDDRQQTVLTIPAEALECECYGERRESPGE